MQTAGNPIYNDAFVTNVLLGVLGFLLLAIIGVLIWIWNKREEEYRQNREKDEKYKEAIQKNFDELKNFVSEQKTANALAAKEREFIEHRLSELERLRKVHPQNRRTG